MEQVNHRRGEDLRFVGHAQTLRTYRLRFNRDANLIVAYISYMHTASLSSEIPVSFRLGVRVTFAGAVSPLPALSCRARRGLRPQPKMLAKKTRCCAFAAQRSRDIWPRIRRVVHSRPDIWDPKRVVSRLGTLSTRPSALVEMTTAWVSRRAYLQTRRAPRDCHYIPTAPILLPTGIVAFAIPAGRRLGAKVDIHALER
jgi:hypothetical protein